MKTDHILFIASGAFHVAKPSDLLPELQGRLPIRVELQPLTTGGFPPHPDRARGEPDQAVRGADGDRGRDARSSPTTPSTRIAGSRPAGQLHGREHRRAAAADGDGARARRDLASPPPTAAAKEVMIDAAYVEDAYRRSRQATPTCRSSSSRRTQHSPSCAGLGYILLNSSH